jgi:hypothetical protein
MRFPRPQFRLSTLLWITLAVACWFGGMRFENWVIRRDTEFDQVRPVPSTWRQLLRFDPNTGEFLP